MKSARPKWRAAGSGTRANTSRLAVLALISASAAFPATGQITIDGSLSPAQSLAGPNYAIGANLGRQVGSNLFQSFGQFNLRTGETATFSGPASVANIVSRVTGGSQSSIDGTIISTIPGVNLFLINPAGVVFGAHASLNVSGSFHTSTANELDFADGAAYSASTPNGSTLTAAAPQAFGFLSQNPAAIAVNGANLSVPSGQQISLVGGPVSVTGGQLSTRSGTAYVAAVGGPGQVSVSPATAPTAPTSAAVAISASASIDTSDDPISPSGSGGAIYIRGGQVTVDNSNVQIFRYGGSDSGQVQVAGTASVAVQNGANLRVVNFGAVKSEDISVSAPNVTVNAAKIQSSASSANPAGAVTVSAPGTLTIVNAGLITAVTQANQSPGSISVAAGTINIDGQNQPFETGISSSALAGSTGNAAPILISANSVNLSNLGEIGTEAHGAGNAGAITISTGALSINGGGQTFFTGIEAATFAGSTGNAGSIGITATTASLVDGGVIDTVTRGTGNAGDITVGASKLTIDGTGTSGLTGISSSADPPATGNAGALKITADTIAMMTNGEIITDLYSGAGHAGQITVNAGTLTINGTGQTVPTGISSSAFPGSTGSAGAIAIAANAISLVTDGEINSDTYGPGNAGQILVDSQTLTANGANGVSAVIVDGLHAVAVTGISSSAVAGSSGNAGAITVNSGVIALMDTGTITTGTAGLGNGGDIHVTANALTIDNAGITANSTGPGLAGTVVIDAPVIVLENVGLITAQATGSGASGDVIVSGDTITIDDSGILTESASGGGGNVKVTATGLLDIINGRISSAVRNGATNAGNVTIHSTQLVLKQGVMSANAFGGNGGNMLVTTKGLIETADSAITASSAKGVNGVVAVSSLSSDVTSGLAQLSGKLASTGDISHLACDTGSRGAPARSSLVVRSRGALPYDADAPESAFFGPRPSEIVAVTPQPVVLTGCSQ